VGHGYCDEDYTTFQTLKHLQFISLDGMTGTNKRKHTNDEKTVLCPVEGCDEEVLSRGLHLHVLRSTKDGHGKSNEVPPHVDLESAEPVGTEEVEMEYPEERESEGMEGVKRLCPYCERPFRGKEGVMIHLGATAGRKNHPKDAPKRHNLDDFPIVRVDENKNVVEVVEEGTSLPTTERRQKRERTEPGVSELDTEAVKQHIEELRENGLEAEAEKAEKLLLGK